MNRINLPKTGAEKEIEDRKWAGWTNTAKPFDPNKPFHRINCPTFKTEEVLGKDETEEERVARVDGLREDGRGFDRGCKIPTDIDIDGFLEEILKRAIRDPREAIRAVPGWVAVRAEEVFQEVEGILLRSYQTWTDVPLLQWHRWYDWNLFMNPAPGYGFLRGRANRPPEIPALKKNGDPNDFQQAAIRNFNKSEAETMECEFDCGLFGSRLCEPDINEVESSGPMFEADLAWPLAGQYAWATGRWIYDCGHPTTDNKGLDQLHLKGGGVVITGTFQEETKAGFKFEFGNARVKTKVLVRNAQNEGSMVPFIKGRTVVKFADFTVDTINGEEVSNIDLATVRRFSRARPDGVVTLRLCEGVEGRFQGRLGLNGRVFRDANGDQEINEDRIGARVIKAVVEAGLTRSELHPTKAVATARWEAALFKENGGNFVPAIQFMFFATTEGGYRPDIGPINTQDYEFIVDLPPFDDSERWPIGKTSEFPLNTGALRVPELLATSDFLSFETAINRTMGKKGILGKSTFKPGKADPIVTLIQPDPNVAPKQVNVKIPLKSLPAGTDYYGVILSLGWHDPTREQARRVKKITVKIQEVKLGSELHDVDASFLSQGEWQLRIGVNGRWIDKREEDLNAGDTIKFTNEPFVFFLADDGMVSIAAHGEETDDVHDIYRAREDEDRILKIPTVDVPLVPNKFLPDREVQYEVDCVRGDKEMRRKVVSAFLSNQATSLDVENDPLGRLDPYHKNREGEVNPIPVSTLGPVEQRFDLIALPTTEVGKSAELAEKVFEIFGEFDYRLRFTVKAEPQEIEDFKEKS